MNEEFKGFKGLRAITKEVNKNLTFDTWNKELDFRLNEFMGTISNSEEIKARLDEVSNLFAKRAEYAMFGMKEGKKMRRIYKRNNIFGKIIHHTYINYTLKRVENSILKERTTRTGIYYLLPFN